MPFNSKTAAEAGAKSSRKGVGNKEILSIRSKVRKLVDSQYDQMVKDLEKLSPKERVDSLLKLMEFVVPRLQRTEVEDVTLDIEEFLRMSPRERMAQIAAIEKRRISKNLKSYSNGAGG